MCAHYHWRWDYLHWGIRWAIVQRILIDAPSYEMAKNSAAPGDTVTKLSKQNAKTLINYINSIDLNE